ncbi:MAG: radical SAM protein [Candidatus Riflebacteria bacterium]|nr:radical SAM protein [Candidatus Riflebacteria bacterium]
MSGLKHRFSYEGATARLLQSEKTEVRVPLAGKLNVALAFPGPYAFGMSNLGFLTIHRLAGTVPGIGVERFFPDLDGREPLPPPFYSFETRRPLGDFDILAFSISFEGDFDRLPGILGPLGIPLRAADRRRGRFPLLVAGGAGVGANPAALSALADLIVPGEGEPVWPALLGRLLQEGPSPAAARDLPGVWAPALDAAPQPAPQPHDVAAAPAWSHIVSPSNAFGGSPLIEVMRGCPRTCTFCLARVLYQPPRAVPVGTFATWLDRHPGLEGLGLIAPSLFDHPDLEALLELCAGRGLRLRNSSVKWERLSDRLLALLWRCGVRGLTLAPETGSEELRRRMGKPLREEAFFATMTRIATHGFTHLKLYFLVGFPGETDADLDATVEFLHRTAGRARPLGLTLAAAFGGFVPKQGTPAGQGVFCGATELKRRFTAIRRGMKPLANLVKLRFDSPDQAARQAWLATVGPNLVDEYEKEDTRWAARGRPSSHDTADHDV